MRSGAVDVKAEVWVGKPVPRPAKLPTTSLPWLPAPHFLGGRRAEGGLLLTQLWPPLPETQPPKDSHFARFQHGGPHTGGHAVQVELTSSRWTLLPPSRFHSPQQDSRSLPHENCRPAGSYGRFFLPAWQDLYIGRSRFVMGAVFVFAFVLEKFNYIYWVSKAYYFRGE